MAKLLGNTLMKVITPRVEQDTFTEVETVNVRSIASTKDAVQDDKVPEQSFWCVEEPFVVNQSIPNDLLKARNGKNVNEVNPVKSAFNLFTSFEDAAAYGQRLNRNLVIFEIKPSATVRPQLALVAKLD